MATSNASRQRTASMLWTCGHRLIFCLHTLMITGGRTRSPTSPDLCDRPVDGELPEIRATGTGPADTLTDMTTPLTARQRLAALHSYAAVNGEDFTGQNLASARTSRLRFTRCSFIGADLRHATLDGCSFKLCDLSGADLRGASLRGISLAGCDLRGADLRDTDLAEARLGSVNTGIPPFGLTDVTGARFEGASLRNVQADGVIG
ncbi:pentapeptide repeat-containing protein [Streptomyces sp. NPDC002922]|uniref:pentapeptide repeat-containing protein n=1 Tax=Streptomyces sp. NPDC002922 TaxID=3154439 RepID=UPI0033BCFBC5